MEDDLEEERKVWVLIGLFEWGSLVAARIRTYVERSLAGQSTVEYALVGALVVIVAAAALTAIGSQVSTVFEKIAQSLGGSAPAP